MTKSRLIFIAVLLVVVAQALLAARYGIGGGSKGGHVGLYDGS